MSTETKKFVEEDFIKNSIVKMATALVGKAPSPFNVVGATLIKIFWEENTDDDTNEVVKTVLSEFREMRQDLREQNVITR